MRPRLRKDKKNSLGKKQTKKTTAFSPANRCLKGKKTAERKKKMVCILGIYCRFKKFPSNLVVYNTFYSTGIVL